MNHDIRLHLLSPIPHSLVLLLVLCVLLLGIAAPTQAAGRRVFPETGQTVRDTLLDFWNGNGGLAVFGLPISDQRSEQTVNGRFEVQHFERERLELHPENAVPYNVLLGRLGDDVLRRQGRDWRDEPSAGNALGGTCQRFDVTDRDVCGPFLAYWQANGLRDPRLGSYARSLALWGLPLTGVKYERNSSGDTVLTQWFERARFEYHPQNPALYRVLLGRLGAEAYAPFSPNGEPTRYVRHTLADGHTLEVPQGFRIEQVAGGLERPRMMATDGTHVFVAEMGAGRVLVYPQNNQGVINWQTPSVLAEGLQLPHSLLVVDGMLYIATEEQVVRGSIDYSNLGRKLTLTKIIDLPQGSRDLYGHRTRTLALGPDQKLYVSIGSSCDVCVEDDLRRATIMRFNLNGTDPEVFATGLRNTVGMDFRPGTNELWGVDNGRNLLGDNIPPEELNLLVQNGNYGWPYCYGDRVPNPEFNDPQRCANTKGPAWTMDAHIAPLGMTFYAGLNFPPAYQNDVIVGIHGSTERAVPAGYNITRIRFRDGQPIAQEDLVRGWLVDGKFWGRPVGVLVLGDGSLIISDDGGGRLYRLWYAGS